MMTRVDKCQWKWEKEAKIKKKAQAETYEVEGTHEGTWKNRQRHTRQAEETATTSAMPTTNNSNDAHTRMHAYSHTPKPSKNQHRKNTHVVEAGDGGGRDDDARVERDNHKSTGPHAHRPRGENSPSRLSP